MGKLLLIGLSFTLLRADDHWLSFQAGPIEVATNAGESAGREALNHLEQLRYTLGTTLGKPELTSTWPIRIIVVKPGKNVQVLPQVKLARDSYVASVTAVGTQTTFDVARILIDENAGPLPISIDTGLPQLFSTLDVEGTHVTLGAKPAQTTRDWARLHLLSVDPAYSGRLRVLIKNLQLGVDPEPAYKNAFEKTPEQIEAQLNRYVEAGQYGTVALNSKPLDPRRQLHPKEMDADVVNVLLADNLLAHNAPEVRAAYEAILRAKPDSPQALEGLGRYEDALKAGSKSARAAVEAAKLASDETQKKAYLQKAIELNPKWPEPQVQLAHLETSAARKLAAMKAAAQLAPRNSGYWQELAHLQENAGLFIDSAKSWAAAERAAQTPTEREQIHQARLSTEQARLDAQDAARRAEIRKKEQEIETLKEKALTDIRTFEAKANAKASEGQAPLDPNQKLEWYKEQEKPNLAGALLQVDCLGQKARLRVQGADHSVQQFLVPDAKSVVIKGGGELALGCGVQKPPRSVIVQYDKKADKKLGTVGEVTEVDFR